MKTLEHRAAEIGAIVNQLIPYAEFDNPHGIYEYLTAALSDLDKPALLELLACSITLKVGSEVIRKDDQRHAHRMEMN